MRDLVSRKVNPKVIESTASWSPSDQLAPFQDAIVEEACEGCYECGAVGWPSLWPTALADTQQHFRGPQEAFQRAFALL